MIHGIILMQIFSVMNETIFIEKKAFDKPVHKIDFIKYSPNTLSTVNKI